MNLTKKIITKMSSHNSLFGLIARNGLNNPQDIKEYMRILFEICPRPWAKEKWGEELVNEIILCGQSYGWEFPGFISHEKELLEITAMIGRLEAKLN